MSGLGRPHRLRCRSCSGFFGIVLHVSSFRRVGPPFRRRRLLQRFHLTNDKSFRGGTQRHLRRASKAKGVLHGGAGEALKAPGEARGHPSFAGLAFGRVGECHHLQFAISSVRVLVLGPSDQISKLAGLRTPGLKYRMGRPQASSKGWVWSPSSLCREPKALGNAPCLVLYEKHAASSVQINACVSRALASPQQEPIRMASPASEDRNKAVLDCMIVAVAVASHDIRVEGPTVRGSLSPCAVEDAMTSHFLYCPRIGEHLPDWLKSQCKARNRVHIA